MANKQPIPYFPPFAGKIAIVAYNPFVDNYKITLDQLEEIYECGFNVIKIAALNDGKKPNSSSSDDSNAKPPIENLFEIINQSSMHDKLRVILYQGILENFSKNYFSADKVTKGKLTTELREYVSKYMKEPALYGWDIQDEPRWLYWNTTPPKYDCQPIPSGEEEKYKPKPRDRDITDTYNQIIALDTRHLVYNNLAFPASFISDKDKGEYWYPCDYTYDQFINSYDAVFPPTLWSYDFYPIKQGRSGKINPPDAIIPPVPPVDNTFHPFCNGAIVVQQSQFYHNLQFFWIRSRNTNFKVPFWAYCLSTQYNAAKYCRPLPTYSSMLWEVFSALAYGAQGICFFTYALKESSVDESFVSAPLKYNGEPTELWSYVQAVNSNIARYNNIFYGCRVTAVVHAVNPKDNLDTPPSPADNHYKPYLGLPIFTGSFGCISQILTENLDAQGDAINSGVLVSHLVNNGIDYIVIVNHSPFSAQNIILAIDKDKYVVDWFGVSPLQIMPDMSPSSATIFYKISLSSGGFKIFSYKNK